MSTASERNRGALILDSNRGENVCRAPALSSERGLVANSDALKSIMVKFDLIQVEKLGWPKLTPRNKSSIFVIFTGQFLLTHSFSRNESHIMSKILSSRSTEMHDQNFVKATLLDFICRSPKVARNSLFWKGESSLKNKK